MPAINFWQLLRSSSDMGYCRLDIGDHRFDQAHLGMHGSQVQLGSAPRVSGPATAASSSGRLVNASRRACGLAAHTYQLHQL